MINLQRADVRWRKRFLFVSLLVIGSLFILCIINDEWDNRRHSAYPLCEVIFVHSKMNNLEYKLIKIFIRIYNIIFISK